MSANKPIAIPAPSLKMLCSMSIRKITHPQERLQQRRQSCQRHHKEMRRKAHKPHLICLELMCTIQNIREIQLRTNPGMNSASDPKNTSPAFFVTKTQENTALSRVLSMLLSERVANCVGRNLNNTATQQPRLNK